MKISRKQLRKLIETTIKPSIPDASDEYLGKIAGELRHNFPRL